MGDLNFHLSEQLLCKKRSKLDFWLTTLGPQSKIAPIIVSPLFTLRLGLSIDGQSLNQIGVLHLGYFPCQYEIVCYPDDLCTCSVGTNSLILNVLFHSHYKSNFSLHILFDKWYSFIHNTYGYLLMKSGCYWELTRFVLSI